MFKNNKNADSNLFLDNQNTVWRRAWISRALANARSHLRVNAPLVDAEECPLSGWDTPAPLQTNAPRLTLVKPPKTA